MPTFRYRAFGDNGELAEGTLEAPNAGAIEALLLSQGLTPFEAGELPHGGAQPWLSLNRTPGPTAGDLLAFTRDFAMLRSADVALDRSLRLLSTQGSAARRTLAGGLLADVLEGASLSDALTKRPAVFPAEYVNAVRAGEISGHAGEALALMAGLLERRAEQSAKIRSALVYPALLVVMALVSTAIVLTVLVPSVAPIFIDSGKPLPAGLKLIVAIADSWPVWGSAILALMVAAFLARQRMRSNPVFKIRIDGAILALPVIGGFVCEHEGARFARTLGSLLAAGVPLLQGLASAQSGIRNLALAQSITPAIDRVRDGASVSAALSATSAFPRVLIDMLAIGEEAGRPAEMLLRAAGMLKRRTEQRLERAMALLTPALTIAIAALVGGLIFAVMSAVLSINDLAIQ